MTDLTSKPTYAPTDVFDVRNAAAYIDMSESWLWRSDVPRVRLGSRVKFLREDLDAFLRQRRTHGHAA